MCRGLEGNRRLEKTKGERFMGKILRQISNAKKTLMNFKIVDSDRKKIVENAHKYTGGNISAWIKYASINYKPKKDELDEM